MVNMFRNILTEFHNKDGSSISETNFLSNSIWSCDSDFTTESVCCDVVFVGGMITSDIIGVCSSFSLSGNFSISLGSLAGNSFLGCGIIKSCHRAYFFSILARRLERLLF